MRGIHRQAWCPIRWRGISPAHAGNTGVEGLHHVQTQDQPRTCGEYVAGLLFSMVVFGSAPHMRGILKI